VDRRQNPRISVQLPAQIWGLDAFGQAFTDSTMVVNMSATGVVLHRVSRRLRIGEVLDIQMENSKAQFRIIWIGANNEVGLQNLSSETFLPRSVLVHCAQAAAAC